jgi:release factor glutamine methyltransferase
VTGATIARSDAHRRPRLVRLPGVFSPPSDTWLLADALTAELAGRPECDVLDVCTGTGAIALVAARAGARVTAIDVGRRAVWNARLNAALNRVRVDVRRGDLFAPVGPRVFDVIVSNPPYVPSSTDALPRSGPERAWKAGRDGRALIERICREAPPRLAPGGALLIVQSTLNGVDATIAALERSGLRAFVDRREPGPLGPLMTTALGGRHTHEDVVVIRGMRSR